MENRLLFSAKAADEKKISDAFIMAAAGVKKGRLADKIDDNDGKLTLYGLYKQATLGDNNTAEPSRFQVTKHAKWSAWNENKGMDKPQAMKKYLEYVKANTSAKNKLSI